jgi:hypothetical protein
MKKIPVATAGMRTNQKTKQGVRIQKLESTNEI